MAVLILEDDDLDAELMLHRLSEALPGVAMHRANDRRSYARLLADPAITLIVSDFSLPDIDGWTALRMASETAPETPFIFVSGFIGEEIGVKALKEGATDYVVKERLERLGAAARRALAEAEDRRERKRAEEALRDSEERFRTLADSAPALIWETDEHGAMSFANRHYEATFGRPAAEMLGLAWQLVVDERDLAAVRDGLAAAILEQREFQIEMRVRDRHGDQRWLHSKAVPRFDRGGRFLGLTGTNVDVTDGKRARAELEKMVAIRTAELQRTNDRLWQEMQQRADADTARHAAEDQLRQAQKMEAFGQLTGGVAHDFNNFLTVILGNLETLERTLPGQAPHAATDRTHIALAHAKQGAQRAAALTQRLLAFARRQPLQPRRVDANRLIADTSEILSRTLGEQIEIRTELAGELWDTRIDPHMLESALLNLAVNARDAMPDGGEIRFQTRNAVLPGDDPSIKAGEAEPGQYIQISIADSGTGIPADILDKVFEPFFTTKDIGVGTGLGLSQVYGFVKQSGGHVRIESEPPAGTTVHIYLPRHVFADHEGVLEHADAQVRGARPGEVILVVEDNEDVRRHSVSILQDMGYGVIEAADGPAALERLGEGPAVSMLFTDVGLPKGMSGRELAEAVQRIRPGLPVLYTSGYAEGTLTQGGQLPPGVNLIPKPFSFSGLALRVRDLLDLAPAVAVGAPTQDMPQAGGNSAGGPAPRVFPPDVPWRDAPLPAEQPAAPTGIPVTGAASAGTRAAGRTADGAAAPAGVLLVEDDDLIRMLAVEGLGEFGWTVAEAPTGRHALDLLAREGQDFSAAILDMGLPDMTGADLVHAIVTRHPGMAIVVASGYGASDFNMGLPPGGRWRMVQKPYLPEQLNDALRELGISPPAD